MVEQQPGRVGQGEDVQTDAFPGFDLVGRFQHLPEQRAPHVPDPEHGQVYLLADAEDLPVDHIEGL